MTKSQAESYARLRTTMLGHGVSEEEVAADVWNPRFLEQGNAPLHALLEQEAERTAAHWKASCSYVAFYGLFYVRRQAWPKALRWKVWERARDLVGDPPVAP